jgi:enoyl-[acyl-carrier protein] reductase II
VLAGGIPPRTAMRRIKELGARLICFAPSLGIARKLVRDGADGLVIEGAEAGGHIAPVATGVLAQEILPEIREVPVFVAGGIGRGEAVLAYLEMGAAGCQLGTRFVCASECVPLGLECTKDADCCEGICIPDGMGGQFCAIVLPG